MLLCPGTYVISNVRASIAVDLVGNCKIQSYKIHKGVNQQWRVQHFDRGYALKSILADLFFGVNDARCGSRIDAVCEHNAGVWIIEHQYDDIYTISTHDTQMYLTLPVGQDGDFVPLLLIEKKLAKGQLWKFEQISEDSGGLYQPRIPTSLYFKPQNKSGNSSAGIDVIASEDSDNLYVNDAHFHTDMLFNMPRTPFTRTQRAATLEWARKLGAKNVPSLKSLDECERRFETSQRRAPDENNLAYSARRE